MAGYYSSCDDLLTGYQCDPCAIKEFARVRNVAFIKGSYYDTLAAAPTDGSLWTAGINANFDIIIIPNVAGEAPEPSPILVDGYGDAVEELISYDRTVNFTDRRYIDNCDFYNLIQEINTYHLAYFTSSQGHITNVPVTIIPKPVITNNIGDYVTWQIEAKWRFKASPCPFTTPAGIFKCYEVQ